MQNLKTSKVFKRLKNMQIAQYYYGSREGGNSNNKRLTEITVCIQTIRENPYVLELLENANALNPLSSSELLVTAKSILENDDLHKAKGR